MKTIKMKKLLEGFAWEREAGKPLPTLNDVAKKYNESNDKTVNEVVYRPLKSNIVAKWTSSDVAQDDLESYLQMIYQDGNYKQLNKFQYTRDAYIEAHNFAVKETRNYVQRVMENIQVYEFIENNLNERF